MKISYRWLKNYADPIPGPEVVAGILTGCGLEVESLEKYQSVKGGLEGVVIGEVLTCEKHPGSDHLSLTTVNIGAPDPLRIVCGAPNVAAGQKVAVAVIGTTLYFDEKEIKLQKTKIRGEVSEGMICAEDELGLGSSHAGIMVLDTDAKPGTPAKEYFRIEDDWIFEIGLTPNRSDAASHVGVARDLTAVLSVAPGSGPIAQLRLPSVGEFSYGRPERHIPVEIEDQDACPRYSGLTFTGVKVAESPEWLKERLKSIGQKPINNIVDITNFILHELGQPLHAFDADKIRGGKVIVRKLKAGTKFRTLDDVERELSGEDLMICNAEGPMCIAGVFGGIDSGVTEYTTNVFLESACFDPRTIRKTARFHGLQTDASFRFERGTDIGITIYALKRAALLIREIAGGNIASEIVDVFPGERPRAQVTLTWRNLNRLIGKVIEPSVVKRILSSLEIIILAEDEEKLELEVPWFKVDVLREADVIEEILRVYGYNNIETGSNIRGTLTITPDPDPDRIRNMISDFLCDNGFNEIMNNSLTSSQYYKDNPAYPLENCVPMLNPLSRELDVLRQTLLYGGLETIRYNQNRKNPDVRLFEFGTVYSLRGMESASAGKTETLAKYREQIRTVMFLSGRRNPETWNRDDSPVDFYDLKNIVDRMLAKAGLRNPKPEIHEYASGEITEGQVYSFGGKELIRFGYLSSALLNRFDCNQQVLYAELDWELLLGKLGSRKLEAEELPKFPEVRRDLALLLDKKVTFAEIERLAFQTEKQVLKKVGLFDVYDGEKIGEGKKSYAAYFILQDPRKTLADKDIDKVMNKLVQAYRDKLGAQLR